MKELKKFFNRLFVLSLVLIICISCNTDEPQESQDTIDSPTVDNPEDKIEYYVKYESYVSIPSSKYITIAITVETEKGRQSLNVPRTWEGVFGPFNELTTLYVASNTGGYNENMTSCTGRISICRGNQPFILKAEKSSKGTSYALSYTVTKEDLK